MSVIIVQKDYCLGTTQESILRLRGNRANREFWRQAARIPDNEWPIWRDRQIDLHLTAWVKDWLDVRDVYEPVPVARGMGTTYIYRGGDNTYYMLRQSSSGRWYDCLGENGALFSWTPPDDIPLAMCYSINDIPLAMCYSINALRQAWDEKRKHAMEADSVLLD